MNITVIFSLFSGSHFGDIAELCSFSKCPCFAFYDLHYDTAKSAKSPVKTANEPPTPYSYITVRRGDLG